MRYLLSKPCFLSQINNQDENGYTPLMNAILESNYSTAALLLDTGKCNIHLKTISDDNILHCASQCRSRTVPEWFIESILKLGADTDAVNALGMTPFSEAVKHYNKAMVHLLYRAGCDVNSTCNEGMTSLHYAVKYGYEDLVQWLVSIGSDVNARTLTQHTPLMFCVQLYKPAHQVFLIMKYLLDQGADPNIQDSCGNTCLLLATANRHSIHKHHIEFLLVSGADPDIPNCHGLTPIWHAVYTGCRQDCMPIIQLLIQENCNLDMPCRGQLLFRLGCSAVYCYETCLTPLEVALDSCLYDVAKVLILAGCQVKDDFRLEIANSVVPPELQQLKMIIEGVPDLQHICRLRLRNLLGRPLQAKIRKLPLPDRMKQYVLLEDVLSELTAKSD